MGGKPTEIDLETAAIAERYSRRDSADVKSRYSIFNPAVYMGLQEKERNLIKLFDQFIDYIDTMKVIEIGCGAGGNLAELIKFGFSPENLCGIDLLKERTAMARHRLPAVVQIIHGDALTAALPHTQYDIIYVSTVFSSILNDDFQNLLSERIWSILKPGGMIVWYDFVYDNPNNRDVRGVSLSRVKQLFPLGKLKSQRLTLAPPVSRRVTKLHPSFYSVLNVIPWLRTHILCAIHKAENNG